MALALPELRAIRRILMSFILQKYLDDMIKLGSSFPGLIVQGFGLQGMRFVRE